MPSAPRNRTSPAKCGDNLRPSEPPKRRERDPERYPADAQKHRKTQADGLFKAMSRVFTSKSTGAGVYVFSDDHCPPHVHARHRGDGWIVRVGFSFISRELELLSIAPLRNSPLRRTVNQLLDDIEVELPACRRSWWSTKQTTCLANQWLAVPAPGVVELVAEPMANAGQVAEAVCNPEQ